MTSFFRLNINKILPILIEKPYQKIETIKNENKGTFIFSGFPIREFSYGIGKKQKLIENVVDQIIVNNPY